MDLKWVGTVGEGRIRTVNADVMDSKPIVCIQLLDVIGLEEFNCLLNYPRRTCEKLIVKDLCTPKLIVIKL